MTLRTKFGTFFGALVLALAASAAMANPASASPADCPGSAHPNTMICLWQGYTMSGGPSYYWTNPSGGCTNIGGSMDNTAKAFSTEGSTWYVYELYTGSNCLGYLVATVGDGTTTGGVVGIANCTNTDYWGGAYGPLRTWRADKSPCNAPTISSFRRVTLYA